MCSDQAAVGDYDQNKTVVQMVSFYLLSVILFAIVELQSRRKALKFLT